MSEGWILIGCAVITAVMAHLRNNLINYCFCARCRRRRGFPPVKETPLSNPLLFSWTMKSINGNTSGVRIPENRQGGTTVPGPPRSGPSAESGDGPKPGEGLPAGSLPGTATVDDKEEREVRSILDRYLGPIYGASTSAAEDDNMSIAESTGRKRMRERESVSDSDLDVATIKGRKVLRSRVIGSESKDHEAPIELSDSPQSGPSKVRGRKSKAIKRLEKLDKLNDSTLDISKVVFTDCPTRLSYEDLNNKDIATVSEGWLCDMEMVRTKSKKLNGKFSGVLKDRIICLKSTIKALAERVKDTGDVPYLRRRNDELASQLPEGGNQASVAPQ